MPVTHAVRRPEAGGKPLGRRNIPKRRRVIHPWGESSREPAVLAVSGTPDCLRRRGAAAETPSSGAEMDGGGRVLPPYAPTPLRIAEVVVRVSNPAFHCVQSGSTMACESRLAFRVCARPVSVLDGISATSWLLLLPGLGDTRVGSRSAGSPREKDQSREHGGGCPSPPTPGEPCAGTVAARARFTGRGTGLTL